MRNRYIPLPVANTHLDNRCSCKFSAASLAIDLKGFTSMCEALLPMGRVGEEVLASELEALFSPMVRAIESRGGFIIDYAGDALAALFSVRDDISNENAVYLAVCAAQECLEWLKENGYRSTPAGDFNIDARAGVAFGKAEYRIVKYVHDDSGDIAGKCGFFFCGDAIEKGSLAETNAPTGEINIFRGTPEQIKCPVPEMQKYPVLSDSNMQEFLPDALVGREPKGEARRVVSVFGRFPDKLDNDRLERIYTVVAEGVAALEGYFSGFHFDSKGWGFLVIFGAPEAHENEFHRALEFVLFARNRIEGELELDVKLGVNSGEVYTGLTGGAGRVKYTCLGDTINLSERLSGLAKPGQIFCSDSVSQHAPKYDFVEIGEHSVKGKSKPVKVHEITGRKTLEAGIPFEGKLCGREKELSLLYELIEPIFKGGFGGVIRVIGPTGMGKSRLVYELQKNLKSANREFRWIYLPCDPIGRNPFNPLIYFLQARFPYAEFGDMEKMKYRFQWAFEEFLHHPKISEENRKELLRTVSILGGYIGYHWDKSLFETLNPKDRKDNFLYSMKALLKTEAEIAPTIIEIEDIHSIDSETEAWFEILTRNVDSVPFIVIATERPDENGNVREIKFGHNTPEHRMVLENLSQEGLRELIASELGATPDKELFEYLHKQTEGNPFFAEQFCKHLLDKNAVEKHGNKISLISAPELLPPDAEALIIARIDAMGSHVKDLLQKASILGMRFAIMILEKMLEPRIKLMATIEEAERYSAIFPENAAEIAELYYLFRHSIMREAVYGMQLPGARTKLHALVLELFEMLYPEDKQGPHYADMCRHAEKAGSDEKYIAYLGKAADYAKNTYSNQQALGYYDRLLKEDLNLQMRADVLMRKQDVLLLIGKPRESQLLCEEVMQIAHIIDNEELRGDALHKLGILHKNRSELEKAMQYYRDALAIRVKTKDRHGEASMLGNIGTIHRDHGELEKAMEYYLKALTKYRRIDDKKGESISLNNIGIVYKIRDETAKAMEFYQGSLAIRRETGDIRGEAITLNNMGVIYRKRGEYKMAIDHCNNALLKRREIGDKKGIALTLGNIGNIYREQGEYEKAMECYQEVLAICSELDERKNEGEVLFVIAKICIEASDEKFIDRQKGKEYLERAYSIFSNAGMPEKKAVADFAKKHKIDFKNR